MTTVKHLSESTKFYVENLGSDPRNEIRIRHLQEDKWVSYNHSEKILIMIDRMIKAPKVIRPQSLLVVGEPQNGKSSLKHRVQSLYRPSESAKLRTTMPVISFDMPSDPNVISFLNAVLGSLGMPEYLPRKSDAMMRHVVYELQEKEVQLILIDEIHHIGRCQSRQLRIVMDAIKTLSNLSQIPIAAFGIPEASVILAKDDQLHSRFMTVDLPEWQADDEFRSLLATFETILPLSKPSGLIEEEMVYAIHDKINGTIGELNRLLQQATIEAIESGQEQITIELIKNIPFDSCKPIA